MKILKTIITIISAMKQYIYFTKDRETLKQTNIFIKKNLTI